MPQADDLREALLALEQRGREHVVVRPPILERKVLVRAALKVAQAAASARVDADRAPLRLEELLDRRAIKSRAS